MKKIYLVMAILLLMPIIPIKAGGGGGNPSGGRSPGKGQT